MSDDDTTGFTPMCVMLVRRPDNCVLLGEKLTGFGTGRVVAPGGHIEQCESALEGAIRETWEETGLTVSDAQWCAALTFEFPAHPDWNLALEVFTSRAYGGVLAPSAELNPWWCPVAELPLERMWDDDNYWLARVLQGEQLRGRFVYATDDTTVATAELHQVTVRKLDH